MEFLVILYDAYLLFMIPHDLSVYMSTNRYIANRLKSIMHSKGVKVKTLSQRTGLAHGTICKIRKGGNHYTWQLVLICEALEISPSNFFEQSLSYAQEEAIKEILSIKNPRLLKLISDHIKQLNNL